MEKNKIEFGVCPSDEAIKENIRPISFLDMVLAKNVNLVSFNFKDDEDKRKTYGVIAQQLLSVGLDELVYTDDEGHLRVDYISLLVLENAYLKNAVNDLTQKVNALINKINGSEK